MAMVREHQQGAGNVFSRIRANWSVERSLSVMLAVLLLHMFVLTPTRFFGQAFKLVSTIFLFFMVAQGILTMVKSRMMRRALVCMVVGVFLFKFASFTWDVRWLAIGDSLFTLISLCALIVIIYRQVSGDGPVTGHRIRGAIAEYLLIAMLFAFLYGLVEEIAPGAFVFASGGTAPVNAHGETFYYFSMVTLTTVGFGDILPTNPFVRSLVMLEALIGTLYPAILIGRLVTLELETRRAGKGGE